MGIDLATWRARIGLNYCRQSRYARRSFPVQWRAARWGVGEVTNSTHHLVKGCMAVVSLSLILGYTFHRRPIGRCGCGKVCRHKLRGCSVPSAEVRGMAYTGIIGVCLLLGVCAVVLVLLLIAGDVERNPGPTGSDQVDKVLPNVDNTPLGEEDRFDVLAEMVQVACSWKAIGAGLRIDSGHLNAIQESNPGKLKECLLEMLTCWLKRNYNMERFGEPTWQAVVKVVAHPAAGDDCALALRIAEKHSASHAAKKTTFRSEADLCASKLTSDDVLTSKGASVSSGPISSIQSEETPKTGDTGSLTTSTTSSFPYLKVSGLTSEQQEELRIRLCVESEDMVHKFWHLHSRVYESLREQSVPVDRLVAHLLSLHAFDPVYECSQKPALQTFFQELQNAGSIEKVLYVIKDYISFFNYRVIEHIVNGLGTDQDRTELQNYEKAFDQYSKRRVYECPPEYGSKSSADHADLVVKVDSVYEQFTVKELKKFQYRLSRIFCVSSQSVLRLCQVEEGCLQLIFQVPSFVQQKIFPLSSEQEKAMAAEGVIRLTCGDYEFVAKEDEDESEPQDIESDAELRAPVFQAVQTYHDIDADSDIGTSVTTEDKSLCWFSDDEQDPVSKKLENLEDFERIPKLSSRHQETETIPELHLAAMVGDLKTVKFLTDKEHQNPLQKDKDGNTALHAAAQGGSLHVLKYFVYEKNCNPACLGHHGRTPLHVATEHAHPEVIMYLIIEQQVESQCKDDDGVTPLHFSCESGHLSIVKFLTEEFEKYKPMKDLMPQLATEKNNTPLHLAALNGHIDIVQFFITDMKCDPHIPGQHNSFLLHYTAEQGHLHIMKYLIDEQGCDPSCSDSYKHAPLHCAAYMGHLHIIKFLTLEKKCHPTSRNHVGNTPIHVAAMHGRLEIVKFFIADLKCSPNIPGQHGGIPLHHAAQKGHLHIMKYLIDERGCDPSCLDGNKQTPLHCAAHNGTLEIVKFLTLEKHCNPNQRNIRKDTPLHIAAREGHLQVVQFFVEELKCPPNTSGQYNATPHRWAETMSHHNVALYLQKFQLSTDQQ